MAYNFNEYKQNLKEAEEWLAKEYLALRTGRATPALLDGVTVESYGSEMSIASIASINVEDARTIRLSPWDMSQVQALEKAILLANLGVSAIVDDKGIRVMFPELTSDRRAAIIKIAKDKLEDAKIRQRQAREKTIKDIQSKEKEEGMGKDEVQYNKEQVDKIIKEAHVKLEEHLERKEKEIQF